MDKTNEQQFLKVFTDKDTLAKNKILKKKEKHKVSGKQ